ncbi:polysaccharide deacetylase family protein [Streptomyces sp. H10-C2]|uniref:polysaccharide deacetylase family protein n=1 Tax=unclassified Streptomyces TaxID=2593676 RepID=UPI0024B96BCB|nr:MULTISPECIES: polysaccharide deacetylase family protein [unclassified Streptomyces]MDJ0343927.1 polysaccharide deacetylase family protein [Streptomyces sp. PH10-H1]MDJ0373368.1 polysaccharide deacetylase family protein [Streptomyces sp. H10-C2]
MPLERPARTLLRSGTAALSVIATVHAAPALSTFGPLRNRFMPRLSGQGRRDHVALTFDDGPDHLSTPHFLRLLHTRDLRATFFLLGSMAVRSPGLVREMSAAGHEIALHGWAHRPLLLRGPRATFDDLARGRDALAEITGFRPRLFRPPYGIMTAGTLLACRRLGLTPVLWSTWGRDWRARATPRTVHDTVVGDLHGGGTILLHDSDCTSATGAWRNTLGALPPILNNCQERGLAVGPLREHGHLPGPPDSPALYTP